MRQPLSSVAGSSDSAANCPMKVVEIALAHADLVGRVRRENVLGVHCRLGDINPEGHAAAAAAQSDRQRGRQLLQVSVYGGSTAVRPPS